MTKKSELTNDEQIMEEARLIHEQDVIVEKPTEKKSTPAKALTVITEDGIMQFTNEIELRDAARTVIAMNMSPDHLSKEGPVAVMSALLFLKQHKLKFSSMKDLAYIKGKLSCHSTLFSALAQRHPEYGETQVLFVNDKIEVISLENKNLHSNVWACVMRVKKKNSDLWNEFFFSETEAKTAGLLSNNVYGKYLKDMLYHKTKTRAYKTCYATALEGIDCFEDIREVHEKPRDLTYTRSAANELREAAE